MGRTYPLPLLQPPLPCHSLPRSLSLLKQLRLPPLPCRHPLRRHPLRGCAPGGRRPQRQQLLRYCPPCGPSPHILLFFALPIVALRSVALPPVATPSAATPPTVLSSIATQPAAPPPRRHLSRYYPLSCATRRNPDQRDAARCDAAQRDAARALPCCDATQRDAVWLASARRAAARQDAARRAGAVQRRCS